MLINLMYMLIIQSILTSYCPQLSSYTIHKYLNPEQLYDFLKFP